MAITNHERVGKALDLLKAGLGPFVQREIQGAIESGRQDAHKLRRFADDPLLADKPIPEWDVAGQLKLMWESWNDVFRNILGPAERGFVGELRGHRNRWAHQERFSSDDAYRVLDSVGRLLAAVSAPQSDELEKIKMELLRVRFDEQSRGERRRQAGLAIESAAAVSLKPWREIVTPHQDVASGRYQQAEFAADPLAGASGRRHGRVPGPGRVLSPYLPDREPEAHAGRCGAPPCRSRRRSGRPIADQFRRRQDPLHAGPLPPVLRHGAQRAGRCRARAAGGAGRPPRQGPARGAGRQQDLARGTP